MRGGAAAGARGDGVDNATGDDFSSLTRLDSDPNYDTLFKYRADS